MMIMETTKVILKLDPETWREAKWDEEKESTLIIHWLHQAEGKTYEERRQVKLKGIEDIIYLTNFSEIWVVLEEKGLPSQINIIVRNDTKQNLEVITSVKGFQKYQ